MCVWLSRLFKNKYVSKYDEDLMFSVSIGEICEDCYINLDLYSGGFTGNPTKCDSCKRQTTRENIIKELGI